MVNKSNVNSEIQPHFIVYSENVSVIGSPYNISQDDAKDTVNKVKCKN